MSAPSPAANSNYASVSTAIATSVNALSGSGNFVAQKQFDDISLNVQSTPVYVDVTSAVQLRFPASLLNSQLTYATGTDTYSTDSVTISAADLSNNVLSANVVSVGALSTLNSDFAAFVNVYFGITGGFESLYAEETFSTNTAAAPFNAAAFISLINSASGTLGAENAGTQVLTGSITINNIAQLLRYIIDGNIFANRTPSGLTGSETDWGLKDKFQSGDLIWCPDGINVTMKLGLNPENMTPTNVIASVSTSGNVDTNFDYTTAGTTQLLTRVANAPILFILS